MGDHVEGKIIVITGAGGGFGRLVTRKCAARGALGGILGRNEESFTETLGEVLGESPPPELTDPERIGYSSLAPELLADQIVHVIDQPWGVSIGDLTVRASGDSYVI